MSGCPHSAAAQHTSAMSPSPLISSIPLASWPTRSSAVIPASTVRWSGSGSRSRPSAVIAPYRRLVPARRRFQPPPGRDLTGDGEHELTVVVLLGQAELGDAEQPVHQGSVVRGAAGEKGETGGLQCHVSASAVKRPGTDGRPVR